MISLLSAIRIIFHVLFMIILLAQPLTLASGLGAVSCFIIAAILAYVEYNGQVYNNEVTVYEPKEGMWCRMCGGACDLENCGMEQP